MIKSEQKKSIIEKYRLHPTDTGSPEVQIAILTERINELTEHFEKSSERQSLPPRLV